MRQLLSLGQLSPTGQRLNHPGFECCLPPPAFETWTSPFVSLSLFLLLILCEDEMPVFQGSWEGRAPGSGEQQWAQGLAPGVPNTCGSLQVGSGQHGRVEVAFGDSRVPCTLSVPSPKHLWGVASASFVPRLCVVCEVKEGAG